MVALAGVVHDRQGAAGGKYNGGEDNQPRRFHCVGTSTRSYGFSDLFSALSCPCFRTTTFDLLPFGGFAKCEDVQAACTAFQARTTCWMAGFYLQLAFRSE